MPVAALRRAAAAAPASRVPRQGRPAPAAQAPGGRPGPLRRLPPAHLRGRVGRRARRARRRRRDASTRARRTRCRPATISGPSPAQQYGADTDLRAAVYAIREANELQTLRRCSPARASRSRTWRSSAARPRLSRRRAMGYTCAASGTWRSLVAHLLWEQGVASSNLAVPTSPHPGGSSSVGRASAFQAEGRGFETRLPLHLSFFRILAFPRARSSAG